MWASFYPLDPSRYLSSFSSWKPKTKKFPFSWNSTAARVFFCRPAADSILMPPTFPIASLNRYTPNFSGVPQKLTWCQRFGLQIFPKWGYAHILPRKNAGFRCFFGRNKFSRLNGRLSPIACLYQRKGFEATGDFYFSIDLLHYKQIKRMLYKILIWAFCMTLND